MTTFNLADLFEAAVDAYGDREYLVAAGERRTYAEMEERANRLAHFLAARGIGPGDHVGIYALNSVEWVETAWAVFKLRAVWININYRYVKDELRYLFTNADLVALVHQAQFSPRVAEPPRRAARPPPARRASTTGAASRSPRGPFPTRRRWPSGDPGARLRAPIERRPLRPLHRRDHRHAQGRGLAARGRLLRPRRRRRPDTNTRIQRPEEMVEKGRGGPVTLLPIAPLMHGATQWCVMGQSFVGNKTILVPKFDPHEVWRLVEARAGQLGDDHRRRDGQAPDRGARRRPRLLRPLVAAGGHLVGRALLGAGQGRVLPPLPQPGDRRRGRVVRVRQQRHGHHDQGRHRHEERTDGERPRRHRRVRRGPPAGRARIGDDRQDRPLGRHPRRLLQRPGEDGRGVHRRSTAPAT